MRRLSQLALIVVVTILLTDLLLVMLIALSIKTELRQQRKQHYKFVARLPNGSLLRDDLGQDGDALRFERKADAEAYAADYTRRP